MNARSLFSRLRATPAAGKRKRPDHGVIGLDISQHELHLCQLRPDGEHSYHIQAKASIGFSGSRQQLLESPRELKRLLAQATRGKRFKGRRVATIMPPEQARIMLLTYKSSITDLDSEVIRMVGQRLEGPLDDYVIDYLPVRNNGGDEEHIVMATVARRSDVQHLLTALDHAGLQVDALDIGPATLRRLISSLYHDDLSSNVLVINTDDQHSYLTIVSGRRLLFDQTVSFGCRQLLDEIAAALEISDEKARELVFSHGFGGDQGNAPNLGLVGRSEVSQTLLEIVKPAFIRLVEEINRVLVFTASETHGIPLSRVCLLGCMGHWPGAQNLIMSLLDIAVPPATADFYQVFRDDDETTQVRIDQLPDLAMATGLALRGLQ